MKNFQTFIIEQVVQNKLTLYHGTSKENGEKLITNGWFPNSGNIGGNLGTPKYLYLTSDIDDAIWFANEKGENTIIEIKDIPIDFLKPDPDDEAGYTMNDLLNRINSKSKYKIPSKFILTKALDSSHFNII